MATQGETRNQTSSMPGRKPSLSRSIGQSIGAAFGKKDGYYFEIEFLTDTPSHHVGEKKPILVEYVEIGRSSSCAVSYKGEGKEALVSGKHLSITRNGGEWTLEHLSKTNSTIINGGSRIIRPEDSFRRYVLKDGDTIQLAKGGPVVRFTVPKENSIQSFRSQSRGTTFIRNIVGQAIAPYKKTIKTLIGIIIALAVFWVTYAVYAHIKYIRATEELHSEIERVRASATEDREEYQRQMEEFTQQINEREQRRVSPLPAPVAVPGIDEMMRNQNLAADIFFIVAKVVAIIDGNEVEVPYYYYENDSLKVRQYGWSATGFLLNDGRFVTARHCIEGWLFPESDTTSYFQLAVASESNQNIKLKAYINAFSTKSGRRMSFTSEQFHIDRSKDRLLNIGNYEDGTPMRWRCVFPIREDWDQKMFANDWAWVQTEVMGSLESDATLSANLSSQQQLLVMGFPQGLGVGSERLEPISYQMNVTQQGLAENGCIMHSAGTDHGNSGGPIFAVKNGKLVVVGIVSRGEARSAHYNWAVPIIRIGNR